MGVHLLDEFLKKADSPKWTGEIVFQPMAPHCWGPPRNELAAKMSMQIDQVRARWRRRHELEVLMNTRRQFLIKAPLGFLVASAACNDAAPVAPQSPPPAASPAGAPPTFGTGAGAGPAVTAETFAEAEKLDAARDDACRAATSRRLVAPVDGPIPRAPHGAAESRARRHRCAGDGVEPAAARNRRAVAARSIRAISSERRAAAGNGRRDRVRAGDALSRWIESRQLTSERLTNLSRAHRAPRSKDPFSHHGHARSRAARAKAADAEIAAGKYRGPLHGIPYGVKDLLDTAGIATTYGAEPFRNRVPAADSAVVRRLNDAGAVLIAKLCLGALALNDIWFGGQTMNPWLLEEGASGSSAGPGAATAAGLVGFSIGSETGGSIVARRCAAASPACGRRSAACRAPAR